METLLKNLQKLINLDDDSPFIYDVTIDSMYLAFNKPKPLFIDAEKAQAALLIKTARGRLESSFSTLHGSMIPDLRQNAQQCLSGLKFLIDECENNPEIYEELKPILNCAPVRCVENYVRNSKGIEPEYFKPPPQDLTFIPQSHLWWYQDDEDTDEDIDEDTDED